MNEILLRISLAFGRCPRCMQKSFFAFLILTLTAWLVNAVQPDGIVSLSFWFAAASSLGLWLSHILAYSIRSAKGSASFVPVYGSKNYRPSTRREALTAFCSGVLFAGIVSVRPAYAANCRVCRGFGSCCENPNQQGCSCSYQTNVPCAACCVSPGSPSPC